MKVTRVNSIGGQSIQVEFDDGVKGVVNLTEFVSKGIFTPLKDESQFAKVYTNGYSVAWSDNLEIDAAFIYSELTGKDPANYFSEESHATN